MSKAQIVPCIFCGELPCACNPTAPKKASASKAKKTSSSGSTNKFADLVSSSSPAPSSTDYSENPFQTSTPPARFGAVIDSQDADEEDRLMEREALMRLWPILSRDSKLEFDHIVNPPLTGSAFRNKPAVLRSLHGQQD